MVTNCMRLLLSTVEYNCSDDMLCNLARGQLEPLIQLWCCAAESWCRVEQCETAARRRVLTQKVLARCKQLQVAAAWSSWMDAVGMLGSGGQLKQMFGKAQTLCTCTLLTIRTSLYRHSADHQNLPATTSST